MSIAKTASEHHHAHHFESPEKEFIASKEGVWLFLATEILMFGGLFVALTVFRGLYPEIFVKGATTVDWRMGALNTVVLIFSSLTMALGIHYFQKGNRQKAIISLAVTVLCGAVFMVVKYFEYSHKLHLGLAPAKFFTNPEMANIEHIKIYFGLYYTMTGLHGAHVLIGMGLITWILYRAIAKDEFGPKYFTPVEGVGLFWHIIDLIWIFLFPLFYLT
jgi:cytochrome c oxidase subunit 3